MNFKSLIQGFFLSLAFIFVLGFFWWGMQWFSSSLDNFFQFKLSQEQNNFLTSVSDSIVAVDSPIQQEFPYRDEGAADLELDAQSAISAQNDFINPEKILFKKNEEEKMPIASLTKLMTAVVVLENFDLSANITISRGAEKQDTRGLLRAGDSFKAEDLLYDMLIESNNSAAYAFFEAMGPDKFVKMMNLKANEIGLKNTYFSSPTGLALTNYSTAKDLVDFAKYILNNKNLIVEAASIPEFYLYNSKGDFHHKVYNLNELLKDPDLKGRIVAGKTGQTKDAGECLILILKAPEDKGFLINVVLSAKNRFVEMKKIINWEDKAYIWK
ncbi:MAG: serine hydrolase [Patescibacteria group bacterium]